MPWLSWRTSPRRCIEDVRLFVNPRHWLTWPCSVVFIAVYNKCVILLSKWVTLNAAPCMSWLLAKIWNFPFIQTIYYLYLCHVLFCIAKRFLLYNKTLLRPSLVSLQPVWPLWNRINLSTPNDPYSGRTAPLTSKRRILYFYSSNIGTEYFKHGIYSPFFSLQNAACFIILTNSVPVLFTFYIQGELKLKK